MVVLGGLLNLWKTWRPARPIDRCMQLHSRDASGEPYASMRFDETGRVIDNLSGRVARHVARLTRHDEVWRCILLPRDRRRRLSPTLSFSSPMR